VSSKQIEAVRQNLLTLDTMRQRAQNGVKGYDLSTIEK